MPFLFAVWVMWSMPPHFMLRPQHRDVFENCFQAPPISVFLQKFLKGICQLSHMNPIHK